MQKTVLLLLLILPALAYSQVNINKTKGEIKKEVANLKKTVPAYTFNVSETDSTLTIIKTDAAKNREDALLEFDKAGKCRSELRTFYCDQCYKQELEKLLGIDRYKWKKLNENQYISKFEENLMIELPTENETNSFSIIRTNWSKVLYDMLTEN
ncbi:MAG: hypothetical protein KBF82_03040 [Chitinophagaceae bacterium]|nr:hypothetical protein [Chitinophagaceae bacterium]MBP9102815.1 hypothetical protein [Chitinophagaceae bacterium]